MSSLVSLILKQILKVPYYSQVARQFMLLLSYYYSPSKGFCLISTLHKHMSTMTTMSHADTHDSVSDGGVGCLLRFLAPPLPLEETLAGTEPAPEGPPDDSPPPTCATQSGGTALPRSTMGPKNSTEEVVETEDEAPLLSLRIDACCKQKTDHK